MEPNPQPMRVARGGGFERLKAYRDQRVGELARVALDHGLVLGRDVFAKEVR